MPAPSRVPPAALIRRRARRPQPARAAAALAAAALILALFGLLGAFVVAPGSCAPRPRGRKRDADPDPHGQPAFLRPRQPGPRLQPRRPPGAARRHRHAAGAAGLAGASMLDVDGPHPEDADRRPRRLSRGHPHPAPAPATCASTIPPPRPSPPTRRWSTPGRHGHRRLGAAGSGPMGDDQRRQLQRLREGQTRRSSAAAFTRS